MERHGRVTTDLADADEAIRRQSVVVNIRLMNDGFGSAEERDRLAMLEFAVRAQLAPLDDVEFGGTDLGGGYWVLHLYGPDAEAVLAHVTPVFRDFGPGPGSFAVLRADDRVDGTGVTRRLGPY